MRPSRPGSARTPARAGTPPRRRRTQQERTAATRGALLDATIGCLFDLGYAHMTTGDVAERAGVSRGAQLHHFPTKAELVTTAVERLFDRRLEEFRAAFAAVSADPERIPQAIDLLWSMFSGPTFYAWLELAVAARTDPALHAAVAALSTRFRENVERTFRELFTAAAGASPFFAVAPWLAFAVMEGLALARILDRDAAEIPAVLGALKTLARLTMSVQPTR